MKMMRVIWFVLALAALPFTGLAQDIPQPPVAPIAYEQCSSYANQAREHWEKLSAASSACVRSLTMAEMMGTQKSVGCGGGYSQAIRCQPEATATHCFHEQRMANFNRCRANVRVFLEGKEAVARNSETDAIGDYGDDLRQDYIESMYSGLRNLTIDKAIKRWVPEVSIYKDAVGRFKTYRDIYNALGDRSPGAILNMGQAFAEASFARVSQSELAGLLFDASSSAVSATGKRATADLFAALAKFNEEAFTAVAPLGGIPTIQPKPAATAAKKKSDNNGETTKGCVGDRGAELLGLPSRGSAGQSICSQGALFQCIAGGGWKYTGNC